MSYALEAYMDARRMERYSCIGPDEQDRKAIEQRREIHQERMIERAMDELYQEIRHEQC